MKKFKKIVSAVLALCLGVGSAMGFGACGKGGDAPQNSQENSGEHTHDATNYGYDLTQHWLLCNDCDASKEAEKHSNDGSGACKVCDNLIPTSNVTYEVAESGTHAIVTGYDADETNAIVLLPEYNGLPVTEIGEAAFENCKYLQKISLSRSITTIGDNAFKGCKSLMGIRLHEGVTTIGDNAFSGCSDLVIFCDMQEKPSGWSETWNDLNRHVLWGYTGDRATNVPARAISIADGMLKQVDDEHAQLVINPDKSGVSIPEEFSMMSRLDAATVSNRVWDSTALWYYNYDTTDLSDYAGVWFATKAVNVHWIFGTGTGVEQPWAYLAEGGIWSQSWAYVYIKQAGQDRLGYLLWDIEVSIGGYVVAKISNQNGKVVDKNRPANTIACLLWDEGFSSSDGNTILFYSEHIAPKTFYCTDVVAIRKGL